jgi:hypothetical protein
MSKRQAKMNTQNKSFVYLVTQVISYFVLRDHIFFRPPHNCIISHARTHGASYFFVPKGRRT